MGQAKTSLDTPELLEERIDGIAEGGSNSFCDGGPGRKEFAPLLKSPWKGFWRYNARGTRQWNGKSDVDQECYGDGYAVEVHAGGVAPEGAFGAMRRACRHCLTVLIGMLASGALANAQVTLPQFSADVVTPSGTLDKVYVGSGKVRIEHPQDQQPVIFIVDLRTQAGVMLDPIRKMYREGMMPGLAAYVALLQPVDPGNPCPRLQQIAQTASPGSSIKVLECKSVGGDTVNGRNTVKWLGTSQIAQMPPRTGYFWIDPGLHFIVKSQNADGSGPFELRNIKEGPQRADLFEIPPGYQRAP